MDVDFAIDGETCMCTEDLCNHDEHKNQSDGAAELKSQTIQLMFALAASLMFSFIYWTLNYAFRVIETNKSCMIYHCSYVWGKNVLLK